MNFNFKKQKFTFRDNELIKDESGRTYGILLTHFIENEGAELNTQYEEAYIFSSSIIELMEIEGINLFRKFVKFNGYSFSEVNIDPRNMPTFQGSPFISDGKVMVSNEFLCNASGAAVSNEQGGLVDESGNFIRDDFGNIVPKSGYFQMANFQFDNFILNAIVMPVLNVLMFRLQNKD